MFKGIKKRFNSSRSGRRKPDRNSPPADTQVLDAPDRKSTSPRQVHPADLVVSAAPYARRSLERGGGRRSPCKTPPSSSPAVQPPSVTSAYPTTPNLCVTGGKIEFITPPDSTLSSTASRCSTLKLSPTCTQREDACPGSGHSPDHATPPSTLSRNSGSSAGSDPGKTGCVAVDGEGQEEQRLPDAVPSAGYRGASHALLRHNNNNNNNNHTNNNYNNNSSTIMESCQKGNDDHLVENLRRENEEVKDRLARLQNEFSQLERQVQMLALERQQVEEQQKAEKEAQEQAYISKLQQYQATIAALEQCNTVLAQDPPVVSSKMLVERCHTLEQANKRMQMEARTQQQQYEVCLDRVATQVVQALLSQKSHQEQCIKLAHQVQDLRRQNAALSSLVGPASTRQTLPCHLRHRCPPPTNPPSFYSLPTSLSKNKQQGEAWPPGGWVASWHVEESSRSHLGDHTSSQARFHSSLQMLSDASIPTSLSHAEHNTTTSSSVELGEDYYSPRDRHSTTTTVTSANTSTTTCWYDIVTSLNLASSPQGVCSTNSELPSLNSRMSVGPNTWGNSENIVAGTRRASTSSSNSDSPVQSAYTQQDPFSSESGVGCLPDLGCEKPQDTRTFLSPPASDSSVSKFSPLSLESTATCLSNSEEQKNCQAFQAKVDNLAFDESKIKVVQNENIVNVPPLERNANLISNATKDEMSSILQVKERILKTLTETASGNLHLDLSALTCEDKSKLVLNKNISRVCLKPGGENSLSEEGVEVTTKDEGYSTMSSDVQAEVKDSVTTCSVTTVQEEPHPAATTPTQPSEQPVDTEDKESSSRKGSSETVSKSSDKTVVVKERKISSAANTEYCDGLRVIYDEEDNNSDVFFIPIQEPENESLYRNSYQKPSCPQSTKPLRSYSDSQLYLARRTAQSCKPIRSLDRHVSEKDVTERSPSTEEVLEEAKNTRSLKRSGGQASLKRNYIHAKEDHTTSGSSEDLWPSEDHHRKYLSPTYSHAELEDWSLDLSSEHLSGVCGEGEGSESVATSGAHHGSLPSIQEATPDLEEDNNEFLWNGATYFKADLDLNWSSKKELTKSWQLDHCKENNIIMSPRSGCSDQPAIWSSSEQLSCCSEGVSKCSSDFENFCEQICNLPELKRVSFCSSEAGGQELSKGASQDTSSVGEHEDELADEMCVDTVFTRDFYRLVKFESNKSLAASSKSLAPSEGPLTKEKIQDLEAGGTHREALASVLGFIAEQRKYCKDREAQDEKVTSPSSEVLRLTQVLEGSNAALFRGTFPKISPRESSSNSCSADEFSMKTLPSYNSGDGKSKSGPPVPFKPRGNPLHDTARGASFSNSIPARHPSVTTPTSLPAVPPPTLPVLPPPTSKPLPSVPSRSSSLASSQVNPANDVEFPCSHVPKGSLRIVSHIPCTNSVAENPACGTTNLYELPPPVPDRNCRDGVPLSVVDCPPVPCRSTSMAFSNILPVPEHKIPITENACNVLPVPEHRVSLTESPPVPKRITSRALPTPPMSSSSQVQKQHSSNGSSKPQGGSLEGKRRSFIRETLGLSSPRRPQSDYCELPSLSENPSGMLKQLQRMAQVEEEEEKKKKLKPGGHVGVEAVSPGDTVGLGTGWVRVQPHIDLQDPQARANLLDGMMESSEGCSSETEEEETSTHRYHELRLMHRSRRKRKASHRSGGDRIVLAGAVPRPSVIGRRDLFLRFGDKEKEALQEFAFLGNFSTSHSDLDSQDLSTASGSAASTACITSTTTNITTTTATTTTSSTPVSVLPITTRNAGAVLPKVDSNSYKKSFKHDSLKLRKESNKSHPAVLCEEGDQGGVDTRSISSVKNTVRQLNKMNHISGIKEPATTMPISPAKSASSTSSNKSNLQKYGSLVSTNIPKHAPVKSKGSEGSVSGALKCSVRQGNAPSSRTPSPQFSVKDSKSISHKSHSGSFNNNDKSQSDNAKAGSPTRIPRIQTSSVMSSKSSKAESPKLSKDISKDTESTKKLKQQCEKALPPKGFSSRIVKPASRIRPSLQQRPPPQHPQQQASKICIRSPRLARLKKSSDPLDSFSNKSLCDSGSSEGSERCGGRLSLSDSCAENFSPIDSGDEVFHKEC
ncbi:hypothetical protein O3P69_001838 [Scylla paramamosain]|uniref:Nck-associated protein 5 n=1 Tax=Scylla paramamosain TaxID=85552 RepID=A0AAW0V0R1_SCYPA